MREEQDRDPSIDDDQAQGIVASPDRAVGPAGDVTGVLGLLYVCPRQDYSVVREDLTSEALYCPQCGSALARWTA